VQLREWALSQGIHPQTAYRWYRQGKLLVPARKMGKLILVGDVERGTGANCTRTGSMLRPVAEVLRGMLVPVHLRAASLAGEDLRELRPDEPTTLAVVENK
jgi:hypothetical protein